MSILTLNAEFSGEPEKESIICMMGSKNPSLVIIVMPNGDPRDVFSDPTLTFQTFYGPDEGVLLKTFKTMNSQCDFNTKKWVTLTIFLLE